MDKKDKLLLRILTILWLILTLGLAYIGFTLFQQTSGEVRLIAESVKSVQQGNALSKEQLAEVSRQIATIQATVPKDGKDGKNGKDSLSTHTIVEKETVVEKQIPVHGKNGRDGQTPLVAFDEGLKRWLVRYDETEEWTLAPVLCFGVYGSCGGAE